MKPALIAIVFLAGFCARGGEPIAEPKLADFGAFVEEQLKLWKAPGVSVAIVRGEELIAATGYGLRNVKENQPMTGRTVQPVASVTKSMTVATLAALAREGKLEWDKPVRDYLPEFRLHDEYATAHVTPRDLVTHATGLPRHDWVWVGSKAPREDLVRRLRYLEPSAEPRVKYQYNNLAYCTAGYLGGRVAGSSWEELVRTRLFEPLGMANSSCSVNDLLKNEDHALGYRLNDAEEAVPIRYLNVDALGPAGSVNSNAEDMSRYLRMLINKGKFEGKEVLGEPDVAEMVGARMMVSESDAFRELGPSQYAMGLRITTYRGRKMVQHSGALRGLSSSLSFLPQEKLGVFVAVNRSDSSLTMVLTYAIYDRLLGLKEIDWSKRLRDRRDKDKTARDEAEKQKITTKKPGTMHGHLLSEYAGEYEHPGYGVFAVRDQGDALEGSFNAATSRFEHFHYEVFAAPKNEFNSFSEQKIQFLTSIDGDVESVEIQFEPLTRALTFKRKPETRMFEPEFLTAFAGDWELGVARIKVSLRPDHRLLWAVSGGAVRELQPIRGTRFAMKDRPGYSVEFMKGENGAFDTVALHTPSGSNLGKRGSGESAAR